MQEKIKEIASRVRELREICGFSPGKMADLIGIPADVYRKYENAEEDFPASVLFEIAQHLKVDMTVLLTGEDPRMHVFTVTRKDRGVSVDRRKDYKYQNLAANFIHKKAEPFVVKVEPKAEDSLSMNSHPGQEFDYVLEGTLKVVIHNNEIILEEGDSIFFDSNYAHGMQAIGGRPARFLAVIL
ncbi:helix-turn-helix domain-containing protein [Methanolobus halotolerans]|uniref:Transcriptional regulator n=1 Tax=Methanolobus halotolerans TaxID=2052935 RepID=A0A4E0Q9G4_9EURY|nr:cupin domain-containing protein [Methanolobus halotolerans]TGC08777.1 transcriptional regulator [Methanolobus halotolerans]